jgi:hypothetical protein
MSKSKQYSKHVGRPSKRILAVSLDMLINVRMYTNGQKRRQMRSDELTAAQARQIHDRIAPTVDYLNRLQNRMVTLRFASDDPLFRLTQEAYVSLFRLSAETKSIARGRESR